MSEQNILRPEPRHVALWSQSAYANPEPASAAKPVIKKVNWRRLCRDNAAERMALIEQMEGPR